MYICVMRRWNSFGCLAIVTLCKRPIKSAARQKTHDSCHSFTRCVTCGNPSLATVDYSPNTLPLLTVYSCRDDRAHRAAAVPLTVDRATIEGAGSSSACLERLIAIVWPEAYRIAFSILRDPGLAEDAAQEACAAIASALHGLKNADAFAAWSYRIIVNHAITTARRHPKPLSLDTQTDCGIRFDESDALDLYRALAALPVVQRAVIVLHYYAGLNSSEISHATGLPRSTVRFHLMLARRALRRALSTADSSSTQLSTGAISDVH
jgi:RNA polymerase sigma factor (sigma-70 family)